MKDKLIQTREVFKCLEELEIPVKLITHPEVISCSESKICYDEQGIDETKYGLCKNILLRDKKGKTFWLLITDYKKQIDLLKLKDVLNESKRIGFATQDDLMTYLGTESGSVSLFSIINDKIGKVKVIIDEDLFDRPKLAFHPNYNGMTVFIKKEDTFKFLEANNNDYEFLKIPVKTIVQEEPKKLLKTKLNDIIDLRI